MILRINQLDPARGEEEAGWAERGMMGPLEYVWPAGARAYEILILGEDERSRPLDESFRRQQLRQLIPEAAVALCEPDERLVIRLDGPLAEGELLAAMHRLTDRTGRGRYAISEVRKLEDDPIEEISSVRVAPSPELLAALCSDPALGLDRSVRLRAFAVPEPLVNPLLDVNTTDDERWGEILGQCGWVFSTTRGLRSLLVKTCRLGPEEIKSRLVRRLVRPDHSAAG